MLKTLLITLHFTVPGRQFETEGRWLRVHTMSTTHHDGHFVLLSLLSHNVGKVFKVTTDNVISLLVEIAIGRIYHVSRCQAIVDPLALLTERFRHRTSKGHHIVTGLFFNLQNTIDVKASIFTNLRHIFLGNLTQFSPGLVSQDFHLEPSTILVLFTPNLRH